MSIYRGINGFQRCQEGRNIQLCFTVSSVSKGTSSLQLMCTSVLFYISYFMLLKVVIAFFIGLFLIISDRHKERERAWERHRQREKQAPCQEPDAGLDPRTPGSRPGPKAGMKLLSHPRIPFIAFKKKKFYFFIQDRDTARETIHTGEDQRKGEDHNPAEQGAQREDGFQDLGSWPELKVFPHPPMRMAQQQLPLCLLPSHYHAVIPWIHINTDITNT